MDWMEQRKAALKRDYESVTNRSWKHFFCPILFRDEDTTLCRAHIVNEAFQDADRTCTIQRADVDSYFGRLFESEFVTIERRNSPLVEEALSDRKLARQFRPEILLDGKVQEHYIPSDILSVPESHTTLEFHFNDNIVPLTLKLTPDEVVQSVDGKWEVRVEKDIRLATLVSLLKCAHLTLFHLLGYRYAFSSGGYLLGREVLGEHFLKARGLPKASALELANTHFKPYVSLVRPVIWTSLDIQGTLNDGHFFACGSGTQPWGLGILLWFSGQTHMVIVPTLLDADSAFLFNRFLQSSFPRIEIRNARILEDRFEVATESQWIEWPEAKFEPLD